MNRFAKLNQQYIGGIWRDGDSQKALTDRNPYDGKPIAEFKLANCSDLDAGLPVRGGGPENLGRSKCL